MKNGKCFSIKEHSQNHDDYLYLNAAFLVYQSNKSTRSITNQTRAFKTTILYLNNKVQAKNYDRNAASANIDSVASSIGGLCSPALTFK